MLVIPFITLGYYVPTFWTQTFIGQTSRHRPYTYGLAVHRTPFTTAPGTRVSSLSLSGDTSRCGCSGFVALTYTLSCWTSTIVLKYVCLWAASSAVVLASSYALRRLAIVYARSPAAYPLVNTRYRYHLGSIEIIGCLSHSIYHCCCSH